MRTSINATRPDGYPDEEWSRFVRDVEDAIGDNSISWKSEPTGRAVASRWIATVHEPDASYLKTAVRRCMDDWGISIFWFSASDLEGVKQ